MGKSPLGNEFGYSLIDLLMASMVSVIIISICYSIIFFQLKQLREIRALFVQNVVLTHIKTIISSRTLDASALDAENIDLKNCLNGIDDLNCTSTESYPLKIVDGGPVAGKPANPVGYNLDAQRCVVGSSLDCMFILSATFRAQCRQDPGNKYFTLPVCPGTRPALIEVFYEFGVTPNFGADRILGLKPIIGSVIVEM